MYLDPPFNSDATYNVLFKSTTDESSQSQIEAFGDTWHWNASAEQAFDDVVQSGNSDAATEKAIVSVKGGQVLTPSMVKDLVVTVDNGKAKMGIFLTLTPPTKGVVTEAAKAGFYKTDYGQFPKIQIVTVEQLFAPSNPIHMPWQDTSVSKRRRQRTPKSRGQWTSSLIYVSSDFF